MKIKLGKKYITRAGEVVSVVREDGTESYPYTVESASFSGIYTVDDEGFRFNFNAADEYDLVKRFDKGFRLEHGKSYKTRDGLAIIKVMKDSTVDNKYCFYTTDTEPDRTYTKKGKWCTTMGEHANDLVELVSNTLVITEGKRYLLKNGVVLTVTRVDSDSNAGGFYVIKGNTQIGSEFGYGRNGQIYEDKVSEYDISALFEGLADIKVGSTYRNARGLLVKVVYINATIPNCQQVLGVIETEDRYIIRQYDLNGKYYSDRISDFDLLEFVA
jgi:hypothetical protein